MDRVFVYAGALPQTADLLLTNKFSIVNDSFKNAAILGTTTVVAGLACTPTAPASLQVNVATGSIFQADATDATAYGDLGSDTTVIQKQGINPSVQTLTITPPGTTGFSQVYLVQAILQDIDSGAQVLSYFNSANENQPYSGPNNSGASNFTTRLCRCTIALKAGNPATTGTQVTPAPDSGYVGLYAITVANGQATITSPNIVQLVTAPFFPTLPQVPPAVLNGTWIYGVDTGAANALVVTLGVGQPQPTAYVAGMGVRVKVNANNTGASTININGLGAAAIKRATGAVLASGDLVSGQIVDLIYDGTQFQMANYLGVSAPSVTNNYSTVGAPYVADTGTANAIVANFSPAITGAQQVAGLLIAVKLANTITGACTINVNTLGVKNVTLGDLTNPPYNVFVAGEIVFLVYDGTQYQIVNTTSGMFYRKPTANYTIYVNTATGSDTLYDGTSATVGTGTSGPLKTIQKAVLTAFGYAPSQYNITIQVAAGTYNESVCTPNYAGPTLIINGAGMANTNINGGNNVPVGVTANGSGTIIVQGPNTLTVTNLNIYNNGVSPNHGFEAINGATLYTNNCSSGAIGGGVFTPYAGGTIRPGNHTFNGSCVGAVWANSGFLIVDRPGVTWTIGASISVSAFCNMGVNSTFYMYGATPISFVNPTFVSGPKYSANGNSVISVGFGQNYFPGSQPGTTSFGGQYIP